MALSTSTERFRDPKEDRLRRLDGVVSFSREVWPRLRERKPALTFTIVGRAPSPEVRELASIPGIEVTGTVDDVRPYYQEAIAAIVPLKVGGGHRFSGAMWIYLRPDESR